MAFHIIRNDITKVKADAIVNTANPEVAIGAGVDSAIYEAAGKKRLLAARAQIGILNEGEVGITPAFRLHAKYIIHSSGPVWWDGKHGEPKLLRQCYDKALQLASENGCRSIAFPLMATGAYGFPKELGMQIAVDCFKEFLRTQEMEIILVVYDEYTYRISGELFDHVQSYIGSQRIENISCDESYEEAVRPRDNSIREQQLLYAERNAKASSKPMESLSLDDRLKKMYTDSFAKHLQQLINKKGMKNSEVYVAANISKQYFSKIMKGNVKPSKSKVLSLAIGLQLNMDETIDFLKIAGYAFSPISQTDVVVEYFIQNQDYNVMKIDIVLFDYGLPLLSE